MTCERCDREISAYQMFLSIKGSILCDECATPTYGCDYDKVCFLCGVPLDPDNAEVVDVWDGDFICADCAHDNMEENDAEGDYADNWYEWTRDELRGY